MSTPDEREKPSAKKKQPKRKNSKTWGRLDRAARSRGLIGKDMKRGRNKNKILPEGMQNKYPDLLGFDD